MTNLEKLRRLLGLMFRLNQAGCTSGSDRILHEKRGEIAHLVDQGLLSQVEAALGKGFSGATSSEVFGHLLVFFRRYYAEGDFTPLRRYHEAVHRTHDDEDVKLHWASADQYYVQGMEKSPRQSGRNTLDCFIHKDLGGFLRHELDVYIKNEVMNLDALERDVSATSALHVRQIKVLRSIAQQVIQILEHVEHVKKQLWLKKKFVVETNYCITLDLVPRALYPDIARNPAQHEEWIRLFAIDKIEAAADAPGYSRPLTVAFLQAHPFLVLDTAFYPASFCDRLLGSCADLARTIGGTLICGDNFQALRLLRAAYRHAFGCMYIDPPYNTGANGFCYKDRYQHSSWSSMVVDRLAAAKTLAAEDGVLFVSIDDNEAARLKLHLDELLGADRFEAQVVVQSNKRGQTYKAIAKTHEYLMVYRFGAKSALAELPRDAVSACADELGPYELWELRNRNPKFGRFNRPNLFFPVFVAPESADRDGFAELALAPSRKFKTPVLPKNSVGEESCWRWGVDKVAAALAGEQRTILVGRQKNNGGWNIYEKARKRTKKAKSIWNDACVINERGTVEVGALGFKEFGFPKPLGLLERILSLGCAADGHVLDFFAGSGTTGHAVLAANRRDQGRRSYCLIEMGDQFERVLKPRLEKAIYSEDWCSGLPVSRRGISHAFKYLRLESYDDALDNLQLERTEAKSTHLDADACMLAYRIDEEGNVVLNDKIFRNPDQCELRSARGGTTCLRKVDLVETFNWLLGLRVRHEVMVRGVRVVDGTDRNGDRVLVLWRNIDEVVNTRLNRWFKEGYARRDLDHELIYVNGVNSLEKLRRDGATWQVRRIEDEFNRLMFDLVDG